MDSPASPMKEMLWLWRSRPLLFVQGCSAKLLRSGQENSVGKEHLLQVIFLLVVDHKMCVIKPWKMEGSDSYWFGVWCEVDCIAEEKKIWWEENPKNPLLKISEILPMCKWWLCSEMSSMQRRKNLGEKNEINWSKLTLNPRLTLTSTRKWVGEPDYQN